VVLTGSSGAFPGALLILGWLLGLALVGGARVACRAIWERTGNGYCAGKRAVVVGAGDAAEMLVRDIKRNRQLPYEVVGFADDDPLKQRRRLHGIAVSGTIDEVPDLCRSLNVETILIAIPSSTGEERRRILDRCR